MTGEIQEQHAGDTSASSVPVPTQMKILGVDTMTDSFEQPSFEQEQPEHAAAAAADGTQPTKASAGAAATNGGNRTIKMAAAFGCLLVVGTALGVGLGMYGPNSDKNSSNDSTSSQSNALGVDGLESSSNPGDGFEFDKVTPEPSPSPSPAPSESPSDALPSDMPSLAPSLGPSMDPTGLPTSSPSSFPTGTPTSAPTDEYYPVNPEPSNPGRGYFNYDPDSPYGPDNWARVDTSDHWLKEFGPNGFGVWAGWNPDDLTENLCDTRDRRQSPKDLFEMAEAPCEAEHEIRTLCSEFPLSDDEYLQKMILPHKLSINSKRRPCLDMGNPACFVGEPPKADYPRYASGPLIYDSYSDMHHFDIKVPGEHTINGETFDAEIQMFHTHIKEDRLSSIGVPIRATDDPALGDNLEYQIILNEFQDLYDLHAAECAARKRTLRRQRQLRAAGANATTLQAALDEDARNNNITRKLQFRKFNPYSDAFLTTMFFYRYDGSITEPPCKDITWWVMNEPMIISRRQLTQTKRILFTHVDSNCVATSVHNRDQSSGRPIQPLGEDRVIQHCKDPDFRTDISKGRPAAKQCRGG